MRVFSLQFSNGDLTDVSVKPLGTKLYSRCKTWDLREEPIPHNVHRSQMSDSYVHSVYRLLAKDLKDAAEVIDRIRAFHGEM